MSENIEQWVLWYADEDIAIFFDNIPDYGTLEYPPNATDEQIKDIDAKPYILNKNLRVKIQYKNETSYMFIPKGYRWNGANIPVGTWLLIANPDDPKILLASCIHDFVTENHTACRDDRYLSTMLLCCLCRVAHLAEYKIFLMFHAVDNYQKLFGRDQYGKKWGYYKKNNIL